MRERERREETERKTEGEREKDKRDIGGRDRKTEEKDSGIQTEVESGKGRQTRRLLQKQTDRDRLKRRSQTSIQAQRVSYTVNQRETYL